MRNTLILTLALMGMIGFSNNPVFAQEGTSAVSDSTQETAADEDTFQSLVQEHKDYITTDHAEDKAYWEDYRGRWKSAIDNCKSGGIGPKDCNAQYLSTLRQEAIDRIKSEKAERKAENKEFRQGMRDEAAEHRDALREAYLQKLEERQAKIQAYREAHPYANPPGPVGGPNPGAIKADRREDVRDRREDVRDRREDRYDATHNPPPGTKAYKRDKMEDVRDRREDVRDRREDIRDRHTTGRQIPAGNMTGNRGYMKGGQGRGRR